jgi:protein phosphatase 1G
LAGDSSSSLEDTQPGSSSGRTRKPRRSVIPEEGEDESSFSESEEGDSDEDEWDSEDVCEPDSEDDEDETGGQVDEDDEDEYMCGGEEPGMDSGCTAVVAMLRGKDLYVANAGDSRCVVCRAGKAFDMSADHKPEDELEKERINKAGGRVTNDGRVNGGLNLSRALGDHVYKRNEKLPPQEQMITALPDIRSISLNEEDEFMVLACDGIWNSMSSQDVVNFVKERLDAGISKLSSISEEMFEFCLAPDTTGDGTGCDNMTCIVIRFNTLKDSTSSAGVKRRASNGIDSDTTNDAKKPKEETV